jgi:hypothetical protein
MSAVTKKIVVQRPLLDPWLLVKFAEARGMTPVEALADVLGRHATDAGAAEEVGCHRESIRLWRRRYADQIDVRRAVFPR